MGSLEHIRNFVIIAHIDAGKSTLADRFLEITGTVRPEKMQPQYLDRLDLERERGITIKMAPVRMEYQPTTHNLQLTTNNKNPEFKSRQSSVVSGQLLNSEYILNLIDTPGHSDFSYEVSRALHAVEGAVLLVDGTKGIQAQTLANFRSARAAGLTIVGVVNKVDLNHPQFEKYLSELVDLLEVPSNEIMRISAKTGEGAKELLDKIIALVPPPNKGNGQRDMENEKKNSLSHSPLSRALIFDSLYDDHKGILAFVRMVNGEIKAGDTVSLLAGGAPCKIKEVGYFSPDFVSTPILKEGEIGYIATGIKEPSRVRIGDTILVADKHGYDADSHLALPGYHDPKPVVYVSFFPDEDTEFEDLKTALGRLRLTDAALDLTPDANDALGRGMKVGFLGELHFDITASRLEREFGLKFITSFPSIAYRVLCNTADQRGKKMPNNAENVQRESASSQRKSAILITTPQDFPDKPDRVWQPMINIEIVTPAAYVSAVMNLRTRYDLVIKETTTWGDNLILSGKMPLAELIRDFDDTLKSVSQGYASWSYELGGEEEAEVRKLEILVAEEVVPALTRVVPKSDLEREGRTMVERLKTILPQQQFTQALQAKAEGKIIARETIPAMKKLLGNFGKTGGDRTRKMKLWKKQKRGKERLKERGTGRVHVPPHLFKELLKK